MILYDPSSPPFFADAHRKYLNTSPQLLFPEIELDGPVLPGTWDSVYGVIAEDSPEAHAKLLPHLKALQTSTWEQLCEKFGNLKSSS